MLMVPRRISNSLPGGRKRRRDQDDDRMREIEAFTSQVSMLAASRQKIGAQDLENAIRDVQTRFIDEGEDKIDKFCDQLQQEAHLVIRYNSSNEVFKKRLFWRNVS